MTTWPYDPALKAWGARHTAAQPKPGQGWWKLTLAQGPMKIGDNHHVFVDVWDEQGNRMVGIPVVFYSNEEEWPKPTEAKKGEPYAVDYPMFAGNHAYGVRIGDGSPSDAIFGFGMAHLKPHHSFRVIFQRQAGVIKPDSGPTPVPAPTSKVQLALKAARDHIDLALELLAKEGK